MNHNYIIVWNSDRSEGFITDDLNDAVAAAGSHRNRPGCESTLGAAFRETYEDDKRTMQKVTIPLDLSTRAQTLLARIERGHWYKVGGKTPKAMQELIDHGLVKIRGRAEVISAAYVANDHQSYVIDQAPTQFKG